MIFCGSCRGHNLSLTRFENARVTRKKLQNGGMMDKKRSVGVTVFGMINLITGLIITVSLFPIFLAMLFGFGEGRLDWIGHCLIKISSILFYIPCGPLLFWSGLALLRRKAYSRKLIIVWASVITLVIIGSNLIIFSYSLLDYIRHGETISIRNFIEFFGQSPFYFLLGIFTYAILLIIFFTRPKVKEQFR